jgi:lysyl-tRNA synthetase class 2
MSEQENEIVQLRRQRLADLQAAGNDPFAQTRFDRTHKNNEIIENFETLEGQKASVAGRIKLKRGSGKIAFADLYDISGKIQLIAQIDRIGEEKLAQWKTLDLGDIVGVTGVVMKSRSGEISIGVEEFTLLAVSIQPLPDKYHGLQDIELRSRQRYADLIANEDTVSIFKKRSQIVREMRRYMDDREFIEVETPMMQAIPGGAAARPFITHHNALDMPLYLRVAPELYLKRLVVGGLERVYEINRNFRNEGVDSSHNPEFTMMECYQAFADYHDMMDLAEGMIRTICEKVNGTTVIEYEGKTIDFSKPFRRVTMRELVKEAIGLDIPHGPNLAAAFEKHVEETLIEPTFVMDFPVENSPLAKRQNEDPRLTYRFELFVAGFELGNAFSELNDPIDQEVRFREQATQKAKGDEEAQAFDGDYIRALQYGLAPTGGYGIGIDRLTMILTGQTNIRDVILFPLMKPES